MPSPDAISQSWALTIWQCSLMVAFARLCVAGIEVGNPWVVNWGLRRWLDHLVDRAPAVLARNRARFRVRLLQILTVLVAVVPAGWASQLAGPANTTVTTAATIITGGLGGGYILWRLPQFEVDGRARYRARLMAEGEANLQAILK